MHWGSGCVREGAAAAPSALRRHPRPSLSHPALNPCPPPDPSRAQKENLPLHLAAGYQASEAVVLALLEAYPEAVKEKDKVCARTPRVTASAPWRGRPTLG